MLKRHLDGINTYELPSLGYRITDHHLPRGFVTSRKPALQFFVIIQIATVLTIYLISRILACGHGYHTRCLNRCQSKCFICLGYLQDEIKKNIDAMLMSMIKEVVGSEPIDESDLSDADEITDDALMIGASIRTCKKIILRTIKCTLVYK